MLFGADGSVTGSLNFSKTFTREEKYRLAMVNMPDPPLPKPLVTRQLSVKSRVNFYINESLGSIIQIETSWTSAKLIQRKIFNSKKST